MGRDRSLTRDGNRVRDERGECRQECVPRLVGHPPGTLTRQVVEESSNGGVNAVRLLKSSLTKTFFSRYCDEAWAILSEEQIKNGKTAAGFDIATLKADLQALRG